MAAEPARYFVDETDYICGHALAVAGAPVVHPGHPDLPEVPRETEDLDWMPIIAARGLVVITRDRFAIKAEWEAFKAYGLRVVRIAAKTDQSAWGTVRLVAAAWDRIEGHVRTAGAGPWLVVIDAAGALHPKGADP